jgi:hypothetical protein
LSDSLSFTQVWTSGAVLNNQWDACCGYFDGDSLLDILGHHWNPNVLHVFESDGVGGYEHVWEQTESLPPGSYCTVTAGDPDDDGQTEILGGEVSTLGKVVLFENVADDSWAVPVVPIRLRNERIRTVRVADTNGNDTNEIVVVTGDASAGGKVVIYEHSGPPGVHAYRLLYEYTTVSYLFQAEVGDADNDGYPEVLLGVGGWHGFPMNIRRVVYDPGTRTYSHKMFTSTVIGLPVSPMAAQLDSSGSNLLLVGSSGEANGYIHVFRYSGNDSFAPVWSTMTGTSGNVISTAVARFDGLASPVFFGAPFGGAVYGYTRDDSAFHGVALVNPGTGAAIRSIDAGYDIRDELILAESAPADYVSVYRRDAVGVASAPVAPVVHRRLHVGPVPGRGAVQVRCSDKARLTILDPSGRVVADLGETRSAAWTLPGVFLCRAVFGSRTELAKLVVLP